MRPIFALLSYFIVAARGYSAVTGPAVMSDRDLLFGLKLDYPGLETVSTRFAANDVPGAISALATYYRTRTSVHWDFEKTDWLRAHTTYDQAIANNAVNATFSFGNRSYTFPNRVINWSKDPTNGGYAAWPSCLNRFDFWNELGAGWYASGATAYAAAFVSELRSWGSTAPAAPIGVPPSATQAAYWEDLGAGVRMQLAWPNAFYWFRESPTVTNEDLILMVKLFALHGDYLDSYSQGVGNFLINEAVGLHTVGLVFPEFAKSQQWRNHAIARIHQVIKSELLADGGWSELSPSYHMWVLHNILRVVKRSKSNSLEKEVPADLIERLGASYTNWLPKMMTPDHRIPRINDSKGFVRAGEECWWIRDFVSDPVLAWMTNWTPMSGTINVPNYTSAILPDSGFGALRSGWNDDATYALFDFGMAGSSPHRHQDKLNLLLWKGGRELLLDNGGGLYDGDPRREYSRNSYSHNTVLIDGRGQFRDWKEDWGFGNLGTPDPVFLTTPNWDYARGVFQDGYQTNSQGPVTHPATHRREVCFYKPDIFIVVDTLIPNDLNVHSYEARWQVNTALRPAISPGTRATVSTDPQTANVALLPLDGVGLTVRHDTGVLPGQVDSSGLQSPMPLGWTTSAKDVYIPCLTVRHQRTGAGSQRFVTLITPIGANLGDPFAAVQELPNSWTVSFRSGRTLRVTLDPETRVGLTVVDSNSGAGTRTEQIGAASSSFHTKIHFQPQSLPPVPGYAVDSGEPYGMRAGGGSYGWNNPVNVAARTDSSGAIIPDALSGTFAAMQTGSETDKVWEIAVPNGLYSVRLSGGEARYLGSSLKIKVEGVLALDAKQSLENPCPNAFVSVLVSDGKLTVTSAEGSVRNKLNYLEIAGVTNSVTSN